MAAAKITADVAQKEEKAMQVISGSSAPRKIVRLYLEGTKASQNDWFLLSDYISSDEDANIIGYYGVTKDSSNEMADETFTYDDGDSKLDCTSGTTGTVYAWVDYYTE